MKLVAGIDVSKDTIEVCLKELTDKGTVRIKRTHSFGNDGKGFEAFLRWLEKDRTVTRPIHVMEATGTYHEDLAYFLYDNKQKVCVVLANKVKYYAKSRNIKTKTDKVDASVIADFGLERSCPSWEPMSESYRTLRDLCRELISIKKALARSQCQLHAMKHSHRKNETVLSLKSEQTAFYQQNIQAIESEIKKEVSRDKSFKEKVDKITTIKGVGLITAVSVLCETNGFQLFNNIRQVVSYAGLDVEMKESGSFKGKTRISKKGNARIRHALYMPALTAITHNKNIKALYERIVAKHPDIKRKGVVAGMRKLLVLIFVLWKKNEVYQENHQWNGKVQACTSGNDETESLHLVKKKAGRFVPHVIDFGITNQPQPSFG
ncbi:MAG: IS110 family transposase [Tannerellaceae bacterium]|jgi:transposase|nr:IS110 family transposase [Tannerellaceae bacterium]